MYKKLIYFVRREAERKKERKGERVCVREKRPERLGNRADRMHACMCACVCVQVRITCVHMYVWHRVRECVGRDELL